MRGVRIIMCQFCEFEYGVAKTSIKKNEERSSFIWEIRPNLSGKHMLFVRVFKGDTIDRMDKSVIFIEYCPMCGRKL